jgi:lipopolysaccharide transport system ATP-binding protein
MKPIIKVENLSKSYRIGVFNRPHTTFREAFAEAVSRPFKRQHGESKSSNGTLWALKEVNFRVRPGEVVGIIGDNGAGKSTLLKILSKITVPTMGRTEVRGRIGSLLEVGTGFHPDLTGRENIFLNSAILGIKQAEVRRKFDEIIAFSEIERFIDTPVKWYSSGMYLRLAFSVAIHLDAEVLFMDEVLAVGDVAFQQKCLDRMHEIRKEGRTILFVSHNLAAVTRLCKRAIRLERGRLSDDGAAKEIVNKYLQSKGKVTAQKEWLTLSDAPGGETVRLRRVRVRDEEGQTIESVDIRRPVGIELVYDILQGGKVLLPKIDLYSETGAHLFASFDVVSSWRQQPRDVGRYVSTVWIPGNFLADGNMEVHVSMTSQSRDNSLNVRVAGAVRFQVVDSHDGDSARGDLVGPISGYIRPLLKWDTDFESGNLEEMSDLNSGDSVL